MSVKIAIVSENAAMPRTVYTRVLAFCVRNGTYYECAG